MKDKLHRADKVPQWEQIPESKRNKHQKLAARTNGWATIANGVSLAGAVLTVKGAYDFSKGKKIQGAAEVVAGRTLDIADGWISAQFKTMGPRGEAVDAGLDKIQMALALVIFSRSGIVPKDELIKMGVQNGLNVIATGIAKTRGTEVHPDEFGKKATFGQWAGIVGHAAADYLSEYRPEAAITLETISSHIVDAATIGLGGVASLHLLQDAFKTTEHGINENQVIDFPLSRHENDQTIYFSRKPVRQVYL